VEGDAMIFREEHIRLILKGKKTQTRRRHVRILKVGRVYRIQRSWYEWTDICILIIRSFQQRLGDITDEEAWREGGYTVEEFRKVWEEINGSWDPLEVVWVYEFRIYQPRTHAPLRAFWNIFPKSIR
jgi:hypothetical protein